MGYIQVFCVDCPHTRMATFNVRLRHGDYDLCDSHTDDWRGTADFISATLLNSATGVQTHKIHAGAFLTRDDFSKEPTCNPSLCRMHVGAGVSIDHEKGCAWVKWNEARRVSSRPVHNQVPEAATPTDLNPLPIITLKPGQLLKAAAITAMNRQYPGWTNWPIHPIRGTFRCKTCPHPREDLTSDPTSVRACTRCKLIYFDCR